MRNLKRALSLALASVMLFGMMVVGASAASYPDVDDNDNVEAIEVLNAVKVMIGSQGNFNPDAAVNRHEMAVIMAKLYLGSEEADDYVGSHPFTDVFPWADKYVAACYENGLIAGTSSTTYGGNQPLTAVQAAAMMLRALGYEKLSQNADDWRVPVTAKANEIRLFKDVVSSPNAQLTRNQVARLTLNTLKADVVTTTSGSNINLGDIGTITTDVKYEKVANATTDDYRTVTGDRDEVQQLCEKLYGTDLRLDTNDNDDVGRPASTWSYKGVGDIITIANEADYTVVLKETPDDMDELLDLAKRNLTTSLDNVVLNGAEDTDVDELGAGDVVEFHMDEDDSSEVASIYVTRYVLDQITAIDDDVDDDDADDGVACYVDFDDYGTDINNTDVPGFNARTYVEDAYVALLIGEDSDGDPVIVDSYIPEDVEDSIDTNKNNTEFTIGSTKYTVAEGYATPGDCVAASTVTPGSDNTYALYLDSNGYILGIVEVESEATSINDVYYLDTVWANSNGMSTTYHAQLVALDGTKSQVQLETKDHTLPDDKNDLSNNTNYGNQTAFDNALRGLLVTISDKKTGDSKSNNDKYNLKVWDGEDDWDIQDTTITTDLKKDSRSVTASTDYRLNADTVYLFVEKSADELDVSRYVGGVAFDAANIDASYIITEDGKTVAKYVIIGTDDASQNAEYSSDVIFIDEASSTKGDGYRTQTVYLPNGREQSWRIDESEYALSVPAFFTYAENDDGYYELDNPEEMFESMDGDVDWQDDKNEGIVSNATFDDHNDLFENLLTVTYKGHKLKDINVADASFKDLHDKDEDGQYNRTVSSLSALAKAIEDNKAGAATLYLNVSEDGAVTIFVTAIAEYVAPHVHNLTWGEEVEAVAATCMKTGAPAHYTCTCDADGCDLTGDEWYAAKGTTTNPGTAMDEADKVIAIDDDAHHWVLDTDATKHKCDNEDDEGNACDETPAAHTFEQKDGTASGTHVCSVCGDEHAYNAAATDAHGCAGVSGENHT